MVQRSGCITGDHEIRREALSQNWGSHKGATLNNTCAMQRVSDCHMWVWLLTRPGMTTWSAKLMTLSADMNSRGMSPVRPTHCTMFPSTNIAALLSRPISWLSVSRTEMSCAEIAFGRQYRKHVVAMTQAPGFLLIIMPNAVHNRSSIPDASLGFQISTFRRMVVEGGARG